MSKLLNGKKGVLAFVGCLALVAASIGAVRYVENKVQTTAASAANTNWGLSFRAEGQTPIGNASSEFLKQYDAYYVGNTSKKVIYLTFDAGYENGYTASILDTLKKHKVKATFFVVGHYIETSPDLVKRMCAEGHIVGNHTYHHYDMSKISDITSFTQEMKSVEELYKKTTGQQMQKFYRPPQGK
ncbi:MAG TPA: polysaccharide deacetylase family protein, partial [Clostridia bacterium]|nr:polysaccharide deacetylase family protein [Clostridia bacterium]